MSHPALKFIIGGVLLAAMAVMPTWGDAPSRQTAVPGTVNYIEGSVSIGSQNLNEKSIGSTTLENGQSLTTTNGKAEVLLTPGVFLRIGNQSAVTMLSPSITDTNVRLDHGEATVEVAEIHPQNDLQITEDNATTRLVKTGLYDFNADQGQVRVLKGQAEVTDDRGKVKVKGGREVDLNATSGALRARKFDAKAYEANDNLYQWSSLRSAYEAEANVNAASVYGPEGWYGAGAGFGYPGWGFGWYWDPWFSCYTFIPGDGILYSPFGWGFYSPGLVGYAPLYGYGGYYRHFSHDYRTWGPGPHYTPGMRGGGAHVGGMHAFSGPRGFSGGFHGGGGSHAGGFHGGGGGRR